MKALSQLSLGAAALGFCSLAAFAQSAISARSGMVHYVEGRVLIAGKTVESKFGNFPEVKENQELKTEDGRAEVLLTPGVFLRLGENSAFRMITNRLVDTRVEFLSGSIIVEADDLLKDNSVTVAVKDASVHLRKRGLYRFDSEPFQLRVYDGLAEVAAGGKTIEVREGKLARFDGEVALEKFDTKTGDALNRWSRRRAEYLAMANVSAAKSMRDSGYTMYSGLWRWNPYFGMFTFIPGRGTIYSPYGFRFWGIHDVYRVYERPVYVDWGGGGYNASSGYSTMPSTSSGYSGTVASAPASSGSVSTAASSAASAPVSHGSAPSGGSSSGRQ